MPESTVSKVASNSWRVALLVHVNQNIIIVNFRSPKLFLRCEVSCMPGVCKLQHSVQIDLNQVRLNLISNSALRELENIG